MLRALSALAVAKLHSGCAVKCVLEKKSVFVGWPGKMEAEYWNRRGNGRNLLAFFLRRSRLLPVMPHHVHVLADEHFFDFFQGEFFF